GLDPVGRREVRELIASLRAQGVTVFMCSHILSDIEVLCDRAAILKRGRLTHMGSLEQLHQRAGDSSRMEIVVAGADAETIAQGLSTLEGSAVTPTAGGARIEIEDEKVTDVALAAIRRAGGRLISVQPIRQSLEELFVREGEIKDEG
ncbi:MAG TPA: hypothetical protein VD966_03710, partial [Pyrinomonadaceae bacterium]|nr:hypothetical protein [Pyrinomonadaceae bacterium]